MSDSVLLRRRRDDDLPSLADVLVRVHLRDGYPVEGVADPRVWLQVPGEIASWVAEVSGAVVGQVALAAASPGDDAVTLWRTETGGDIGHLALLSRLFVDPEYRSCGAGRKLVQVAVDYSRESGRAIAFDVMEKDRAAIRLYERMGARRLGAIVHHHSEGLTEPAAIYAFSDASGRVRE